MACWEDILGWVKATYPDAEPDTVARHAVSGMHQILTQMGGARQWHSFTATSPQFSLPVPDGFRVLQVYSVTVGGCCLESIQDCGRTCRPYFDADEGVVELFNVHTLPTDVRVEYGLQLVANAVSCEVDTALFGKFAPALSEWVMSRLSEGRSHRSARTLSRDHLIAFTVMVNQLKQEQSRRGVNRQFQFKGTYV